MLSLSHIGRKSSVNSVILEFQHQNAVADYILDECQPPRHLQNLGTSIQYHEEAVDQPVISRMSAVAMSSELEPGKVKARNCELKCHVRLITASFLF